MWLRRIDSDGSEFRYELEDFYTATLMTGKGQQTQMFVIYKYYKNNDGEFKLCKCNEKVYVTIEMLLSAFVVIDSEIDKKIKDLQEFKKNAQAQNLEKSLAPFTLGCVEESNNVFADCANLDKNTTVNNLD